MSRLLVNYFFVFCSFLALNCTDDSSLNNRPRIYFEFNPDIMNSESVVEELLMDTVHLNVIDKTQPLTLKLCDSTVGWQINDSIFSWTPAVKDTGINTVKLFVLSDKDTIDTISWNVVVKGNWPANCPYYTHKDDAQIGSASALPKGFFIYNPHTEPGLYISSINGFNPQLIPNTSADRPVCISISDDGKWICYVDKSRSRVCLVGVNGCNKTIVPVSGYDPGFPTITGFYRNSPYGNEIYYLANTRTLKSIKVDFSSSVPSFSNDRILAQFQNNYQFNTDDIIQLSVVKDQVFGEIMPVVDGRIIYRSGYLTIPGGGTGIADESNVYKWKDNLIFEAYGCGHTQTFDGSLCLANAGSIGSPDCTPRDHNGFYISKFFRDTDEPVSLQNEYIEKYSISINWCPPEYQGHSMRDVDFWGWYFGNNNDYVIGRQMGSLGQNSIWMVHWSSNTWFRLTPKEQNVLTLQPAVYFYGDKETSYEAAQCIDDTSEHPLPYDPNADWFNPNYKIKKPNGGEVFHVGDVCTLKVSSRLPGHANLYMSFDNGISMITIPGLSNSINPYSDTLFTFAIPDTIKRGSKKISTVSDQCIFYLIDYGNSTYADYSDSTFSIIPKSE